MTTEVDPFNPNAGSDQSLNTDDSEAMAFLSLGNTAAVWPREGFEVEGTILSWEMRDQRKNGQKAYFVGNELKAEDETPPHLRTKANAARQLKITIQAEATGKTWTTNAYVETPIPDDTGIRDVWVKGRLKAALVVAMREAGVPFIEKGGYINFKREKNDPIVDRNKGARHNHSARYVPAAKNTHFTRFGGQRPGAPVAVSSDTDPFA